MFFPFSAPSSVTIFIVTCLVFIVVLFTVTTECLLYPSAPFLVLTSRVGIDVIRVTTGIIITIAIIAFLRTRARRRRVRLSSDVGAAVGAARCPPPLYMR